MNVSFGKSGSAEIKARSVIRTLLIKLKYIHRFGKKVSILIAKQHSNNDTITQDLTRAN